eukprot:scaffold3789_cov44-Attheya_sp.AAC.7
MAEPTALRLHDNQSFQAQLGHPSKVQTMAHLNVKREFKWSLSACDGIYMHVVGEKDPPKVEYNEQLIIKGVL